MNGMPPCNYIEADRGRCWLHAHLDTVPHQFLVEIPGVLDTVDHPPHYGGADNPYEAIKVIEAWQLGFNLGNTIKYVSRAGHKEGAVPLEDLRKAAWYLNREIENRS